MKLKKQTTRYQIFKNYCSICLFLIMLSVSSTISGAFAAHPLITDDTGTQGKGKFQVEINSEFTSDKETTDDIRTKETGSEVATIISYGIIEDADIVIGLPYRWKTIREDGAVISDNNGISDMSFELKWRVYEMKDLSLAFKPGLTLATGDENKGLGNGRPSYSLTFITTKEIAPWTFHLNLAYTYNLYKLQEDKDANRKAVWHISSASEIEIIEDLKAVLNIGMEKNSDKFSDTHPAFILGGVIFSIAENFDIDLGVKGGLNKPETDYSILAGMALRF